MDRTRIDDDLPPLHILMSAVQKGGLERCLGALRLAGHRARGEHVTGLDALAAALARNRWDVVLVEQGSATPPARDVGRLVHEHDATLPYIVVSPNGGARAAVEALRGGAADFVDLGDLEALVPAIEREAARRRNGTHAHAAGAAPADPFRTLVERMLPGVLVHRQGRPLYVNPAFSTLLGYDSPAELLAPDFRGHLIAEVDRERIKAYARDRLAGLPVPDRYEYRALRKDGSTIWLDGSVCLVDWQGEPAHLVSVVDVGQRREVQERLEQDERLLRVVFDTIPHRLFVKDTASRFVMANAAFAAQLGEPAEALVGRHTREVQSPALTDRERAVASDRRVLEGGEQHVELIEPCIAADGGPGFVHTIKVPLRDGEGRVSGLLGLSEDVTAAMRAEQEARRAHARLAAIMENAPAAILYLDGGQHLELWNEQVGELFPEARPYLVRGTHVREFTRRVAGAAVGPHGDARQWATTQMQHLARAAPEPFEVPLADGRTLLVNFRRAADGGTVLVALDISQRKHAEQALAASEANYRLLMEQAADAIFIADARGRFLQVNPRGCEMTGYGEDELRTLRFTDLIAPESVASMPVMFERLLAGERVTNERPLVRKDGSGFVGEITAVVRSDGLIQGSVRDATDRNEAERARVESQRLLQAVFDTIPHHLFVKDDQSRYLLANESFERVWGRHDGTMPERFEDIGSFSGEEIARTREQDRLVLSGKLPRAENIHELHLPDGSVRTFRTIKTPLRDASGAITGLVGVAEDVTELERAQQALRAHQRLLQAVFDTMPHLVFVKDGEGRYMVVNRRFCDALATTPEALLGKLPTETAMEPDVERRRAQEIDRQVLAGELPRSDLVQTFRYADDLPRAMRIVKEPLKDEAGRIYGIVGMAEDITALYAAEREANVAYMRLNDAVQHIPAGFYLYDAQQRLVAWNERVFDLFPVLREHLRPGSTFEEVLHLALQHVDVPGGDVDAYIRRRLAEFRDPPEQPVEQRLVDGRWLNVVDRRTAEGGTVCIRVDVTEQKRAEQALRESEQRFRLLTENAPDVIFRYRFRPERGFEYVSPVVAAITGYTPEEHYADPELWLKIAHPDDRARQAQVFEIGEESAGALVSLRWQYKDAGWLWIEERCSPVFDDDGRLVGIEGIVRDVSSRKELEDQLTQAQRMEAVGRLAGGIAHDFNNMLSVMGSYSTFVLEALPEGDPARDDVKTIQSAVDRSAALTRQLLAFSRKQVLQLEEVQLNELVQNMEKILRRLIGEDIMLNTRLQEGLGPVTADAGQIEQIIMNLAVNARDAMPTGGTLTIETENVDVMPEMTERHAELRPGPYVMLAVTDTGVGMSEEVRRQIFEPFFTTKPLGQGTGLGLSTVYGIVKQLDGEIWVYSEEGLGATFKIFLPRSDGEAQAQAQTEVPQDGLSGNETILLVEDEDMVRFAARRILEGHGYHVLPAAGPGAALALAEQDADAIDLVLTDVVMPELSGPQLVERLLAAHAGLKVLYMTGYTETTVLERIPGVEQAEIVQKPFAPETLLTKVRRAIERGG